MPVQKGQKGTFALTYDGMTFLWVVSSWKLALNTEHMPREIV